MTRLLIFGWTVPLISPGNTHISQMDSMCSFAILETNGLLFRMLVCTLPVFALHCLASSVWFFRLVFRPVECDTSVVFVCVWGCSCIFHSLDHYWTILAWGKACVCVRDVFVFECVRVCVCLKMCVSVSELRVCVCVCPVNSLAYANEVCLALEVWYCDQVGSECAC